MASADDISRLFGSAMEQIDVGVILFDDENRILHFNRAMELISGWPRAEVLGRNVGLLAPPAMRDRYDTGLHPGTGNRIHQLLNQPREVQLIRKDGQACWIGVALSQLHVDDHCAVHMAFIRDVTVPRQQQERTRLLSLGFDHTDSAVLITDGEGRIVHFNTGFAQMLGLEPGKDTVLGQPALPLLLRQDYAPARLPRDLARLRAGEHLRSDERVYGGDGEPLWCSITTNPIFDDYGTLVNLVSVLTDITHSKIHEVLQNRMLDAMVREVPTADIMLLLCREVEHIAPQVIASVLRVDAEGRLRTLAGPSLPQAYSDSIDGVMIGPRVGSCGTAAWCGQTVVASDIASDPNWEGIRHLALDHGLAACWSTPIKSSDDRVLGTFAFYYRQPHAPDPFHQLLVEVSVHLCALALEREEARSRIRKLAFYDDLTGLPNRNLLHAQADQAISAARTTGNVLAVLFIDLDRFKQVNDSLGHPAGDELLRTIARRLQEEVGPQDIVGRLAGDEFVVVLTPCDAQAAAERTERIQRRLSRSLSLADIALRPSASIGISVFPHDGPDMETLLHRADMAMYQAKHSGRNGFRFFSHEMDKVAQERLALEAALREALEDGGLQLHYQPQINLQEHSLHSVEALARWRHPTLGQIPPGRFIALAEECGLIGDLDQWALRTACRQLARWRRQGVGVPSISVNLSPTNFHNLDLPQQIAQILQAEALAPADLTVEITEDVLLDNNPATLCTLEAVRALGVRLSMDDFGTGYSSLSYLRQLPISELKLDRSFVCDIEHDAVAAALTRAILHIGHSLQLDVVAEGVESAEQLRLLGEQGYRVVQGFHFTPALPAEQLCAWLQQWRPATSTAD
ncbi:EAL domain-containing protein [Stenotrophomonas sp. YIM B06876]|uniref:EAL domain-containing protein n=1 Tax=Stenotrophomonas sp. YIM B06876 TaxID=3060211 RepID=UPI0027394867|nr:EAL domain-containing protein [Stenotrophomonas sp. YIM B06876]